ncbi:TPA: hypothetical protein RPW15_001858 [Campylobacter fetus subsp. venerealis]|nr:hypothetical protein [Campylobacter fetus]QMS63464.1 hypothetical protein GZ987_002605 [Campylobacter fetus]QMS65427.1 hypothetical protein GZ986_002605 [Campylobacter fetus]CDF64492.1 hypothetical protein CSG_5720 [Campylobacter fetus subsp. venerealis str. 84-112]HDX6240784.1 hypothetical protein [Campylobacter fetus subsp. venerealis]HDX6242708.1 hypothetical protein [Campylobacter fetus subsp. venerealis]
MLRFESYERQKPLNNRIKELWDYHRAFVLDYMYDVFDSSIEKHIIHTEKYAYEILSNYK